MLRIPGIDQCEMQIIVFRKPPTSVYEQSSTVYVDVGRPGNAFKLTHSGLDGCDWCYYQQSPKPIT